MVVCLMSEMFWSTNFFILVNHIGFFFIFKIPYVHMWPFYREDPHQGVKRCSWGMFAHYSFLCRGGKAVFFLLPRKLPLGIKVDFVGRALHIPKGKKKTDPWMGIVCLSTFAHFTSLNTPFKTAVPENTRGKKEAKKKFHNRIIDRVKYNVY